MFFVENTTRLILEEPGEVARMRICYIADGVSIHTRRWLNHFARKGHEVHLISNRFPAGYEGFDQRIMMHRLANVAPGLGRASNYLSAILWPFQVRRLVTKIGPDIVDAHFLTVFGYLGAVSGFHPLVLTAWGSDVLVIPKRNPIHLFLTRQALKRTDRVLCVSSAMKDEIVRLGGDPDRVTMTHIGVDTRVFSPAARNDALRRQLGPADCPLVISTRALNRVYDVGTLIRAIPQVLQHVPQTRFIVRGDGEQRDRLQEMARDLAVSDSVRFIDWVPDDELPGYLATSDVYVSTSRSDGTSLSLLEALSCGVAPIVTDIPANRPWVTDGHNGFLFPPGDSNALAEKLVLLLEDSERRSRFSEMSRNLVAERAEYETEMSKVEQAYGELRAAAG